MFSPVPIGFVQSPFKETSKIPRGLGAKHDAEGVLEILREFAPGLMDIEGFSHLFVLWEFDRADGYDLIAHPPADEKRGTRRVFDAVASTAESDCADGGGVAAPRWDIALCARRGHAGWHADSGHQALFVERAGGEAEEGMAGGSGREESTGNRE